MSCSTFSIYLLEVVVDLALERYPALADRHVHFVSWNSCVPLEGIDHSSGKVDVGAFSRAGQAYLNVVGYCLDVRNAVSGFLSSDLFQIRIDPASQSDDPILDRDTDFVRLDARIPLQFF